MSVASGFFLRAHAYRGDPVSWTPALLPAPAPEPLGSLGGYDTRRLAVMARHAVAAADTALARGGLSADALRQLGVVALSHNGPCAFSELFFRRLLAEDQPHLVTPTPFTESVLNIVPTHLSIALRSNHPVYALNTDLRHFFTALETLDLLLHSGQMDQALFCACEEFSELARPLLAACDDFPGRAFADGALALLAAREPAPGSEDILLQPVGAPGAATGQAALDTLHAAGVEDVIWSAYSGLPPAAGPGVRSSPLAGRAMEEEQMFTVGRLAEVVYCAEVARRGRAAALLQADEDRTTWIIARRPT